MILRWLDRVSRVEFEAERDAMDNLIKRVTILEIALERSDLETTVDSDVKR